MRVQMFRNKIYSIQSYEKGLIIGMILISKVYSNSKPMPKIQASEPH